MASRQSTKPTGKKRARKDSLLRRYQATLRDERAKDDDRFYRIKILPPAVRPTDVDPRSIRKAVREAMRKYIEKHAKSLEPG